MALNFKEQEEFLRLARKIEFPTELPIFFAWCDTFGTVCAELIVTRNGETGKEVFLTYREDNFFKGWHLPGCTHLPIERIENTIERAIKSEIGIQLSEPRFFGWFERAKGSGNDECPRGHEFSFVYEFFALENIVETDRAQFFPIANLPDTIPNQSSIFEALNKRVVVR